MMWVVMIGCCLVIPVALIIGGASIGGLAGVSPWVLGGGAALVIARRMSGGTRCGTPPEHDV